MRHFSEQPWADFVRGLSGPELSRDIRAHLAEGCRKCSTAHNRWRRVSEIASTESTYTPQENLVRLVKVGFAGKSAPQPKTWTLAGLIFDSLTQPQMAGVRSGTLNTRQVIYEAEGMTVDLRFGRRAHSREVHVVGQVLDKHKARAIQNNASVELSTEHDQLVATAAVGALGEFHLEFEAKEHLWLSVETTGRNTVRIPLTNQT
jgi:hypothetical protein